MLNRYARVLVCLFALDVSAFAQQSGPGPSLKALGAPTIIGAIQSQDTSFDIPEAAHQSTTVVPARPARHLNSITTRSREPFAVLLLDGKRLLVPLTPTQLAATALRTQVTAPSSIQSGRFP